MLLAGPTLEDRDWKCSAVLVSGAIDYSRGRSRRRRDVSYDYGVVCCARESSDGAFVIVPK